MGQEALRSHRTFRVLADRLARAGIPSLRFDYYATGDSGGSDSEGDFTGWQSDILVADQQLREMSGSHKTTWLGLRIGALLAAAASSQRQPVLDNLILIDPVIEGTSYLLSLSEANRTALMFGFSNDPVKYQKLSRMRLDDRPGEALGYEISKELIEQIRSVEPEMYRQLRARRVEILAPSTGERQKLEAISESARMTGCHVNLHPLQTAIDWATNDAAGSTIAPTEIVDLVLRSVQGIS